jgi:hypothetical protein
MKHPTGDAFKYENADYSLDMAASTRELLIRDPKEFASCCNGVGSKAGGWLGNITYHITPNTIWFMDITPASDIHDVEYSHPSSFISDEEAKHCWRAANQRFVDNCRVLAFTRGGPLLKWRLNRIKLYGMALGMDTAWESFMSNRSVVAARRWREKRSR